MKRKRRDAPWIGMVRANESPVDFAAILRRGLFYGNEPLKEMSMKSRCWGEGIEVCSRSAASRLFCSTRRDGEGTGNGHMY